MVDNTAFLDLVRQVESGFDLIRRSRDGPPGDGIVDEETLEKSKPSPAHVAFVFHAKPLQHTQPNVVPDSELKCELMLEFWQDDTSVRGRMVFATDKFHRNTIDNMITVYLETLRQGVGNMNMPIRSLSLSRCLSHFQLTAATCKEHREDKDSLNLLDAFRAQAASSPTTLAVKDSSTELTYADLDQQSNRLSIWLARQHFLPGTLVGVLGTRSCQTVVAFLAILKASLAYLPLDDSAPAEWSSRVLSSAPGLKLVLVADNTQSSSLEEGVRLQFVPIAKFIHDLSLDNAESNSFSRDARPTATSLAYVTFSLGRDGRPQGAMIEHRGILKIAKHRDIISRLGVGDRVAHITDIAHEGSTWEMYTALLNGASLICFKTADLYDGGRLTSLFRQEEIRVARFTPAALEQYLIESPQIFEYLKILVSAGDVLNSDLARKVLHHCYRGDFFNAYGSTEVSGLCILHHISRHDTRADRIPIGRPMDGLGALVMDTNHELLPDGVLGELVITGHGLMRKLLHSTQDGDDFVHIFHEDGFSTKGYCTGDVVRRRPFDGEIELLGSQDLQVRIAGQRIDLRSIEAVLLEDKIVQQAAVISQQNGNAEPRLFAVVTLLGNDDLTDKPPVDDDLDAVFTVVQMYTKLVYSEIKDFTPNQLGHDFVGWRSMYDGEQIPQQAMMEWLEDTIASILNGGQPGHVLEIGTGTGMILFNLGKELKSYIGLEPVKSAVDFVSQTANSRSDLAGKVTIRLGTATDAPSLDHLPAPLLIIMNSVSQHFPSRSYFDNVVKDLLQITNAERIFFGDIRSLALHDEFLISKAMYRLGPRSSKTQLKEYLAKMRQQEKELLIDPGFFTGLKLRFPDSVEHVEIIPKLMEASNELSCYRYSAVVYLKRKEFKPPVVHQLKDTQWSDFSRLTASGMTLQQHLHNSRHAAIIAVAGIPNSRTSFERAVIDGLGGEGEAFDGDVLRQDPVQHLAFSPRGLVEIAKNEGYRLELSCARQFSTRGSLDAVFHRLPEEKGGRELFDFATDHDLRGLKDLVNDPQGTRSDQTIEKRLHSAIQTKLPHYMVPGTVKILQDMPIGRDNQVDRRALAEMVTELEFMSHL
jgi:amino acid adenylation domain-containing protein